VARLPMSFEENQGQTDRQVRYLARGDGYSLFLKPAEAVFRLRRPEGTKDAVLRMSLHGASQSARVTGERPQAGQVNYLRGRSADRWKRDLQTYSRVRSHDVYPGVDLVYYGRQRELEYDFLVQPGADAGRIRWHVEGGPETTLASVDGDLRVTTQGGGLTLRKPVCYQEVDGVRQPVSAEYVRLASNDIGFELGAYDRSRPLVIDPLLDYSSYVGGGSSETGTGVAVARNLAGEVTEVYVAGSTTSTDFPVSNDTYDNFRDQGQSPDRDLFVARFSAAGIRDYATYIGGRGDDVASRIAVDGAGNTYLTGYTLSTDFPNLPVSFDPRENGGQDAFVTKLAADGKKLVYSGYLGGRLDDRATGLAVSSLGEAVVCGVTQSPNFPTTTDALQSAYQGGTTDGFVTAISPSGVALSYSTYLGGSRGEEALGVAVDSLDAIFVTGWTISGNFPVTGFAFQPGLNNAAFSFAADAFITKLDPFGGTPGYSTYLGGSGIETATAVAVDEEGSAYVTGSTQSTDFPVSFGAPGLTPGGKGDAYVAKLDPFGSTLAYATYLGGAGVDAGTALTVSEDGFAYVAGTTDSANLPTRIAFQPAFGGRGAQNTGDGFVAKLNVLGTAFVYTTYLGGSDDDSVAALALGSDGELFAAGTTHSTNFATTLGSFQPAAAGGSEGFFVRLVEPRQIPAQPTNLVAEFQAVDRLAVTWEDHSSNEVGFSIERKVGDTPWRPLTDVGPNVSAYTDRFIVPNVIYRYRVRAHSDGGLSAYAESAPVQTPTGRLKVGRKLNFGNVKRNKSKEQTLWIENTSPTQSLLVIPSSLPSPFSANAFPVNIPPFGSFGLRVRFSPSGKGRANGVLTLTTSDPRQAQVTVRVSGASK
jgi:hypothetical protein